MLGLKHLGRTIEKRDGKVYEVDTFERLKEVSTTRIDEQIASLEQRQAELEDYKLEVIAVR